MTRVPEYRSRPSAAFLAATSLLLLKPLLKRALRPLTAGLAGAGITANQVTIVSLVGSIVVGSLLSMHADGSSIWGLLPAWMLVRMALATIDGTLAIDFGQKSRLGGILNEVGDIISDIAMLVPLMFLPTFPMVWMALVILLMILTEIAGIVGPTLGSSRRIEGPFDKVDRALAVGLLGFWLACMVPCPTAPASFCRSLQSCF